MKRTHICLMAASSMVLMLNAAQAEDQTSKPDAASPSESLTPANPSAPAAPAQSAPPAPAENVPGAPAAEGEKAAEAPPPKMSEAQQLVFGTPHLKNIATPSVITYKFERKGVFKDDFTDEIKLNVDKLHDGGAKDVSFKFFEGERNRPYPPMERFNGNPLVMVYLSRDVSEMARLVGGSANYYRSQVRYAFFDKAIVSDVEVDGPDGKVKGRKIVFQPFVADSAKAYEMGPNLQKTYEFIIAEGIPGGVHSIRTMVPPEAGKEDKGNVIEESMVFDSVAASPVADAQR